jgi:hypothetical protein
VKGIVSTVKRWSPKPYLRVQISLPSKNSI